ncbi:hypothetical protein [Pseudoalteromonas sp. S558]|uniref:hypothetical protein n=1 Tax=Pseudoalteromonas sp. S558 TaxID=2066515 RepID=UPI00110BB8B0|nr:hypothetical protein [Pseudoalteromonas sp. S558]TMO01314.1 hypothetical protein CWB66_15075 [Pseudoalteromonas sp. S558]
MEKLLKLIDKHLEDSEVVRFLNDYSLQFEHDDDEYYISFTDIGLEIIADDDKRINTVFISSLSKGAIKEYSPIIKGVNFRSSRAEVRNVMGIPTKSGNPLADTILEPTAGYDRYDNEQYAIHFEYNSENSTISLITLMSVNDAP